MFCSGFTLTARLCYYFLHQELALRPIKRFSLFLIDGGNRKILNFHILILFYSI